MSVFKKTGYFAFAPQISWRSGFCFLQNSLDYNTLYIGASVMAISAVTYFVICFFKMGDEYMFLIVSMLVTLGTLMLCRLNFEYGIKQIIWYLISVCAFYISFLYTDT